MTILPKRLESRSDRGPIVYLPSKDEIKAACERIRAGWSRQQLVKAGHYGGRESADTREIRQVCRINGDPVLG